MNMMNAENLHAFEALLSECHCSVWIETMNGENYDLRTDPYRMIGITRLLEDKTGSVSLYAADPNERMRLTSFMMRRDHSIPAHL